MRHSGLTMLAILGVLALIAVPVLAAGVHNVSLTGTGSSPVTGMATTIVGDISGSNPYHNVEINIRIDQTPPAGKIYQGWAYNNMTKLYKSLGAFNVSFLNSRDSYPHFTDTSPYSSIVVSLENAHSVCEQPTNIVAQALLPGTPVASANFLATAILPPSESIDRQMVEQQFKLTDDQVISLRMGGWGYRDIALDANIASRCNRSVTDVASMMSQGQSLDQIASTCGTSTAMILSPVPTQAVASSQTEVGALDLNTAPISMPSGIGSGGPIVRQPSPVYMRYPNGEPIVTGYIWRYYRVRGYTWREVAAAANIASVTGESLDYLLREVSIEGKTFYEMSINRGLDPRWVSNTSGWPFRMGSGSMAPAMSMGATTGGASGDMTQDSSDMNNLPSDSAASDY